MRHKTRMTIVVPKWKTPIYTWLPRHTSTYEFRCFYLRRIPRESPPKPTEPAAAETEPCVVSAGASPLGMVAAAAAAITRLLRTSARARAHTACKNSPPYGRNIIVTNYESMRNNRPSKAPPIRRANAPSRYPSGGRVEEERKKNRSNGRKKNGKKNGGMEEEKKSRRRRR